ncbi:Tip elongation aberrant protein 1 [Leucoagaricus sp. SymC.cos]|nr:Tip elongation aberrant protein 1 [Leucoagaricus sp. SymC.cos]
MSDLADLADLIPSESQKLSKTSVPTPGPWSYCRPILLPLSPIPGKPVPSKLSPPPFPRHKFGLGATKNGDIYFFGGLTHEHPGMLYHYSIEDNTATVLQFGGNNPGSRTGHAMTMVGNNILALHGGEAPDSRPGSDKSDPSLFLFNLVSRKWLRIPTTGRDPGFRCGHSMAVVGTTIFMFGGYSRLSSQFFNDLWAFDLNTIRTDSRWELVIPSSSEKPPPRSDFVLVPYQNQLILFGGVSQKYMYLADTWSFNTTTKRWSQSQCRGDIPFPRSWTAGAVLNDVMYVIGGFNGGALNDVFAFKIPEHKWFRVDGMGKIERRNEHRVVCIGTKIFVFGGLPSTLGNKQDMVAVLDTKHVNNPELHRPEQLPELDTDPQVSTSTLHEVMQENSKLKETLVKLERDNMELKRWELTVTLLKSLSKDSSIPSLQGMDVQMMVDFLAEVLESQELLWSNADRRHVLDLLRKTAKSAHVFPKHAELCGTQCNLAEPIGNPDGYGLFYKGTLEGQSAQAGEFALLTHVSHPSVIPLYGTYLSAEHNPRICIVSPWMENGDLANYLTNFPDTPRIPLMSDVAAGLQFLHDMGIIHADLKAKNILVSQSRRAMLADIGVSAVLNTGVAMLADVGVSTAPNTTVASSTAADISSPGTVYWMAPELLIAKEAQLPTPQSDMWGFGCTCFEAMTGQTPFLEHYKYPALLVGAFMWGQATPLRPIRDCPPTIVNGGPLVVLAEKCWNYESSERPTAAEAVKFLIELNVEDNRPSLDEELAMFETVKSKRAEVNIDYSRLLSALRKLRLEEVLRENSKVEKRLAELERDSKVSKRQELIAVILDPARPETASLASLRGSDARAMVDFLASALESQELLHSDTDKRHVLQLLKKIVKSAQVFPKRTELSGVQCDLTDPSNNLGGYGLIYKGNFEGQTVCVKAVLFDESALKANKLLRAQVGELALLAHISHPNIIPLYGAFLSAEPNPRICIVSPWMENGDLVDYLRNFPLTPRIPLMFDVAVGLQFLHNLGIIHADLKARNVLVSRSQRAMLADFGVSTVLSTSVGSSTAADFAGTAYWMAPELLIGEGAPDVADMAPSSPGTKAMTDQTPFLEHYRYAGQLLGAFIKGGVNPLRPKRNGPPTIIDGGPLMALAENCWDYEPSKRPTAAEAVKFIVELNEEDNRPSMDEELSIFEAVKSRRAEVKVDYQRLLSIAQKVSFGCSISCVLAPE